MWRVGRNPIAPLRIPPLRQLQSTTMPNYRRARVAGATYFFTVNLLQRRSRLLAEPIDALQAAIAWVRAQHPVHVDGWVVNPEHFNPVTHGWAKRVADWPNSSFAQYVEAGIYPVDWGGGAVAEFSAGERG
jgi:hypothetical protein